MEGGEGGTVVDFLTTFNQMLDADMGVDGIVVAVASAAEFEDELADSSSVDFGDCAAALGGDYAGIDLRRIGVAKQCIELSEVGALSLGETEKVLVSAAIVEGCMEFGSVHLGDGSAQIEG